jgi:hypothetical protein
MKNYEVELKYTSYIITSVQADTEDEAIDLAWAELFPPDRGGAWELESVTEMENANENQK